MNKLNSKQLKNGLEDIFLQKLEDKFKSYVLLGKPIPRYLINFQFSQFRFNKEKIKIILCCLEKKDLIKVKNSGIVVKKW